MWQPWFYILHPLCILLSYVHFGRRGEYQKNSGRGWHVSHTTRPQPPPLPFLLSLSLMPFSISLNRAKKKQRKGFLNRPPFLSNPGEDVYTLSNLFPAQKREFRHWGVYFGGGDWLALDANCWQRTWGVGMKKRNWKRRGGFAIAFIYIFPFLSPQPSPRL